jgi:hypothetical protein
LGELQKFKIEAGKKTRRAHEGLKERKGKENIGNPTPTWGSGEAGKAQYEIQVALIFIQVSSVSSARRSKLTISWEYHSLGSSLLLTDNN